MSDEGEFRDTEWESLPIPVPEQRCKRCERRKTARNPYERAKVIGVVVFGTLLMVAGGLGQWVFHQYAVAQGAFTRVPDPDPELVSAAPNLEFFAVIGWIVLAVGQVSLGIWVVGTTLEYLREREREWKKAQKAAQSREVSD